jgi:hypothetical protein
MVLQEKTFIKYENRIHGNCVGRYGYEGLKYTGIMYDVGIRYVGI